MNFSDLNLKFNSFKFETSRILETITINIKILYSRIIFENELPSADIIAKEYIKTELAGVGKPLKNFDVDFLVL